MRIHLAILWSAAWLVPAEQRAEWLAEWRAELWYVGQGGEQRTAGFCLGSFRDALWLRQNSPPDARGWLRLESPAQCLGFLALMAAAVCVLFSLFFHTGIRQPPIGQPLPFGVRQPPIGAQLPLMLMTAVMSLPMLLGIIPLRLGKYPADRFGWRWAFFAAKIALVLPLVFFAALSLWPIIRSMSIQCMVIGYVIAFRWAVIDQRRRCPECLRLLQHPAPIGQASQTFLEWYGTEFVCPNGHGLLHVPEIPTVSFRTQSWMHLDRSWSGLFS
jgi:hypothetical protein